MKPVPQPLPCRVEVWVDIIRHCHLGPLGVHAMMEYVKLREGEDSAFPAAQCQDKKVLGLNLTCQNEAVSDISCQCFLVSVQRSWQV